MQGSTTPVAASFPWHPTLTFLWSVPVLWLPSVLGPGYPSLSPLCAVPAWIRGGRWPSIHPIQGWSLGFPGSARDPSHLSVVQTVMPLIKVTWAPSFELRCYDSARLHVLWLKVSHVGYQHQAQLLWAISGNNSSPNVAKLLYFSCLRFLKPISQTDANMLAVQSHPMARYKLLLFPSEIIAATMQKASDLLG